MNEQFVHKWKSQVKKGTLAFVVLNILDGKEYYGYELLEQVKLRAQIEMAEGTLYPLMNRLKKENLVTAKWVEQPSGIPRKYYTLTNDGIATLEQMRLFWKQLETSIKTINP